VAESRRAPLCSEIFEMPQKRTFNAKQFGRSFFGMVLLESGTSLPEQTIMKTQTERTLPGNS